MKELEKPKFLLISCPERDAERGWDEVAIYLLLLLREVWLFVLSCVVNITRRDMRPG